MINGKLFDHTLLKAETTTVDIDRICLEAKNYDLASVCVNPFWVKKCKENLINTSVKVCTVIGFPLGAESIDMKVNEMKSAINDGADEIDFVIHIGKLKENDFQYIDYELKRLREESKDLIIKAILEVCLLTDDQIRMASKLCSENNINYVKTSTGFSNGGATLHSVSLIKDSIGIHTKIKASTGIDSLSIVRDFCNLGVTRFGTSKGIKILHEQLNLIYVDKSPENKY